jgi:predicted DNA-binding transcriptional regulator AlpA
MTPPVHIISAIKAMMSGYPEAHTARVIDAIKHGPRVMPMDVARTCKVSRRTVWEWVRIGKLPKPTAQGKQLRFWNYGQVAHLMNAGVSND